VQGVSGRLINIAPTKPDPRRNRTAKFLRAGKNGRFTRLTADPGWNGPVDHSSLHTKGARMADDSKNPQASIDKNSGFGPDVHGPNVDGPAQDPGSADAIADEALRAAEDALRDLDSLQSEVASVPVSGSARQSGSQGSHGASAFAFPSFDSPRESTAPTAIDMLSDVNLNVKIELGRTRMLVEDVLKLSEGAVVELDKLAGDPVDVYVNDRHVARGEVLVLNDNFCVRINEIIVPVVRAASA